MNKMLQRFLVASLRLNYNEAGGEGGEGGAGGAGEGAGGGEGSSGGEETSYFDQLPDNVKEWDEYKNAETPDAFWQQIEAHRSHLGQSIRIPGQDAGTEDWDAFNKKLTDKVPDLMRTPNPEDPESMNQFYTRMGRPESSDKYEAPAVKDAEGNEVENFHAPLLEPFKEIAYAEGLSQSTFANIVKKINDFEMAQHLEGLGRLDEQRKAISTDWGSAEDKNYRIIANFAKLTDAPEHVHQLIADKEIDHATAVWLLKSANAAHDPEFRRAIDDDSRNQGVMTPAEAHQKIDEIMNNKEHPYWNKMDPGHKDAVARVRELHILKDPKNALNPSPGTAFTPGSAS